MTATELSGRDSDLVARVDASLLRDLAQQLVRRASPNPPGAEEEAARFLAQACADLGFTVETEEVAPGRPNVYVTAGDPAAPGLLILGHTDTVPVGEGWTRPPLSGQVDDGVLYGRGACDMKAGLAAAVAAMAAADRAGALAHRHVLLAAVVDEEETGQGVRALLRRELDAYRCALVPEPTQLQTVIACRGNCYVDVEVAGVAAHAGSPEQGRNAIYGAARIVAEIRRLTDDLRSHRHPLLGSASWSVGLIDGGSGTAIVPDACRLSIDRRLLPGQTGEDARGEVERAVGDLRLADEGLSTRVTLTMELPGFELSADHPLVGLVQRATADAGGPAAPAGGWTAACDGGYLMRDAGIPTVVLGPGSVEAQAHKPDESVPLSDAGVAARAYALCISRLAELPS